ncbi:MAG: sensor histidine kinase [Thermoplasmatota archaeon]
MSSATENGPASSLARVVWPLAGVAAALYVVAVAGFVMWHGAALHLGATWLVAGLLLALFLASQVARFDFEWRGHWLSANLDEAALFVALVALPVPAAVLVVPLAEGAMHLVTRRERLKGVFNVANIVIATAVASAVFAGAAALGAPALLAAAIAIPTYVLASNVALSFVFGAIEGVSAWRVYEERFAPTTVVLSAFGIAGGLLIVLLARANPFALLLLVPVGYVLKRHGDLASRADREARVHRLLAEASLELAGRADLDAALASLATTCASVLGAGRVEVDLAGEPPMLEATAYARDVEGGAAPGAMPLTSQVPGPSGTPLGEIRVFPRPGSQAWGEVEAALVREIAGQAGSAVQNARALVALARAHEAELATAERLARQEKLSTLGTLVANVAHEVGNPLSYLRLSLANADLEAKDLAAATSGETRASAERLSKALATATRGAERMVEITDSLRAVARHGPAGNAPVDLNVIAQDIATVVRVGFPKNVKLALALAPGEARVEGHAGELTQVLLNLVKNASEAIGERGGNVWLATRVDADRVIAFVEDDGPGVPDDVRERLFQPFFTTKTTGTGLGLNISRGILRAHGGTLRCEPSPAGGARFLMELPRLGKPPVAPALPVTPREIPHVSG